MKLSKAEIISIIITVLFMVSAAVVTLNEQDSATVSFNHLENPPLIGTASDIAANQSLQGSESIDIVNINTATAEELCALPGIGEVLAGKIITYRNEHGQFKNIDEIMNVSGIGTGKFEKIKNCITITQAGGSQ